MGNKIEGQGCSYAVYTSGRMRSNLCENGCVGRQRIQTMQSVNLVPLPALGYHRSDVEKLLVNLQQAGCTCIPELQGMLAQFPEKPASGTTDNPSL